jgi:hypothetical protein
MTTPTTPAARLAAHRRTAEALTQAIIRPAVARLHADGGRGGAGRGRRSGPNGNAESAAPHTNGGWAS